MCDHVSALRSAEAFEGKSLSGDELAFSVPSGGDCGPCPTPISEGARSSQSGKSGQSRGCPAQESVAGGCQLCLRMAEFKSRL